MIKTYKIVRSYYTGARHDRVVKRGLTIEQARAHITSPESNSRTCKRPENVRRTRKVGVWCDNYGPE